MSSSDDIPINTFRLTTDPEHSDGRRPALVDGHGKPYPPHEGLSIRVGFTAATHPETPTVQLFTARDLVQNLLSHDGPGRHRDWTEGEREMMAAYLEQRPV